MLSKMHENSWASILCLLDIETVKLTLDNTNYKAMAWPITINM